MLQYNFKIAQSVSWVNTAADFFFRLEPKVKEKMRLKLREEVQSTSIEVTISSPDVTDEEQFFFTQAHKNDESEERTFERKKHSGQNAKQWVTNEEPSSSRTSVKAFTEIDGNTATYSMNGIKENARKRVEQDVNLDLNTMKLKFLVQPFDEVLMTTDSQYKHDKANEDCIIIKDGWIFWKKFWRDG